MVDLVRRLVKPPWKLVRHDADKFMTREVLAQPNMRLAILDDEAVEENDRGRLLAQIRKHFSGISLLYVADNQTEASEKRARANGAHYYVSKPLSLERFSQVLQSFLQTQQPRRAPLAPRNPGTKGQNSASAIAPIDAGIRVSRLELNREDSQAEFAPARRRARWVTP